jgi:hypothetical protein
VGSPNISSVLAPIADHIWQAQALVMPGSAPGSDTLLLNMLLVLALVM